MKFGLLTSKNEKLEKNQEMIIDFLQKFHKDYSSKKPKGGVQIPKFKKISFSDSYEITSLGLGLLQLISEQCNMTNLNVSEEEDLEKLDD